MANKTVASGSNWLRRRILTDGIMESKESATAKEFKFDLSTTRTLTKVSVSIYNLSSANILLSLVGLGGAYHAGLVIGDREFCFSFANPGLSGIYTCQIGSVKAGGAVFRETIDIDDVPLSVAQCEQILREMIPEWMGETYSLLNKNCTHFVSCALSRLGVQKTLPSWVSILSGIGSNFLPSNFGRDAVAEGFREEIRKNPHSLKRFE